MKRILFAMFLLLGCLSIHAESNYQSFDPKTEGEVLIYEKDWQGVEYSGGWVEWASGDTETFWAAKGTDEGLAITVHTKQGQIWQPQVMVVPDAFPLEAGHDYIVRLTLKVPSDGIYQVNMGSWVANTQYQASVTDSDEWQEIDVNFPQFGWDEEWLNNDIDSRNYLSSCHVLLQCGWMVGTTIVKKVQVIEKTKGGTSDVNPDESSAQDIQLLYEKHWANVEYSEWLTAETVPDWTFEATDEGLVINNPHIQNLWWHPLVQCGEEDFFSLEEGHDYFVRLTMKVPSDGIYKMVLGDWGSVDRYVEISETPSDEWQEIDVEFSNYYTTISNALVYILIGDVVGTTILKKVQVYEKLKGGETAIKTHFQLQDEDGIECYDFKEGDNIIFSLEIKNDTDEDVWLPPFTDIIGHDVFRVYSQNGEEIGTPWNEIWSDMVGADFIGAHCSVVFFCPWFDIPALYYQGHEHFYSAYSFYKTDEKSPLPKGDYYSKFDIKLNDKTITCHRNFKIRDNSTTIKTIKAPNAEGTIYNLAGQKVDASYKGIVIQNGKKRLSR